MKMLQSIALHVFWTPGLGRKGPMKQGLSVRPSFRPSFRLSVSFLRIGSLVFFLNLAWCQGHDFEGQMDHFGPKNGTFSQLWICCKDFFKFCTVKRANRQMEVIIMVCTKKIVLRTNGPFWARKWHIFVTLDWLQEFFKNFAE